jgi:hypothetical protein
MNKEGKGFIYLRQKFPCISEVKIKEGLFVGPEVKQLFQDPDFRNQLNSANRRAWEAFEKVCSNSLEIKNKKTTQKWWRSYFPHTVPWGATCH